MNHSDIEKAIMDRLYESMFPSGEGAGMNQLREKGGWNEAAFERALQELYAQGYIRPWTAGNYYRITSAGMLYAEAEGLAPEEMAKSNQRLRTKLLAALAEAYEEHGRRGEVHISALAQDTGYSIELVVLNLYLLEELDYTESPWPQAARITSQGVAAVAEWREQVAVLEEFDRISALDPHARGRAFQKALAHLLESQGWSPEEGVRTPGEEIDVIFCRERECFLVECKWEKDPIEASVIREIYGKIENRAGVAAVVASMSGFTQGANEGAENYLNKRIILLFGPEDIRSMFYRRRSFEGLYNEKYKEASIRRRIAYS